jgi:hypothetical protein
MELRLIAEVALNDGFTRSATMIVNHEDSEPIVWQTWSMQFTAMLELMMRSLEGQVVVNKTGG